MSMWIDPEEPELPRYIRRRTESWLSEEFPGLEIPAMQIPGYNPRDPLPETVRLDPHATPSDSGESQKSELQLPADMRPAWWTLGSLAAAWLIFGAMG